VVEGIVVRGGGLVGGLFGGCFVCFCLLLLACWVFESILGFLLGEFGAIP